MTGHKELPLTDTHLQVLRFIQAHGCVTVHNIADGVGIRYDTAYESVRGLLRRNLVNTGANPPDQSGKRGVILTWRGADAVVNAEQVQQ